MMNAGAIRPSQSPYSSNAVIVRKKDGTIRFCVDFSRLSNKTVKYAYPIPKIEETLHLLAGSRYFTKLDLKSGNWQVEIQEDDKSKLPFMLEHLDSMSLPGLRLVYVTRQLLSKGLWNAAWGI